LKEIPDCRDRPHYELFEVLLSALLLFLFKKGSRNALNNERENRGFVKNIKKLLGFRLVHLDTADEVLRLLDPSLLEELNFKLLHILLRKKVFHSQRLFGDYFLLAIDGTHVMNTEEGHCEQCLLKTFQKGNTLHFHSVLEAKLVTKNGFSVSLASEWIENDKGHFDKQDCELKAFKRLAEKIKKEFPQVKFCILADGLYPNSGVFDLCEEYQWQWIITLKDGNLKTFWQEILGLEKLGEVQKRQEILRHTDRHLIERNYRWYNGFLYQGSPLYWFECQELTQKETKRFAYVSSIEIDYHTVLEMTSSGRLRWRIENQGFLNQKQRGYALNHKYSRVSMRATKNYYRLMQIAHLINQLFELQQRIQEQLKGKMTIQHLFIELLTQIRGKSIRKKKLQKCLQQKIQIRFA